MERKIINSFLKWKDKKNRKPLLVNSGIAYKLNMVPAPELPLSGMADSTYFKVYMSDVGLLRRKSNVNYRTVPDGDTRVWSIPLYILFRLKEYIANEFG